MGDRGFRLVNRQQVSLHTNIWSNDQYHIFIADLFGETFVLFHWCWKILWDFLLPITNQYVSLKLNQNKEPFICIWPFILLTQRDSLQLENLNFLLRNAAEIGSFNVFHHENQTKLPMKPPAFTQVTSWTWFEWKHLQEYHSELQHKPSSSTGFKTHYSSFHIIPLSVSFLQTNNMRFTDSHLSLERRTHTGAVSHRSV